MWLLVLFILIPMIEIALFVQVGGLIGLWPTLAIVLSTAVAGSYLMRRQGLQAWMYVQRSMAQLRDPTRPMAHGAMILFAGALLLTPGFFTDACGLLLLIPAVRDRLMAWVGRRVVMTSRVHGTGFGHPPRPDDIIDGEYEVYQPRHDAPTLPPRPPRDGGSGWTRH